MGDYSARSLLVQPLTNNGQALKDQLQAMTPLRMTNIALAVEYGWHMVSNNTPYTEGVPYNSDETLKAVVILTDGKQTVGGYGQGNSFNVAKADQNTEALCEAMKDRDILVVTIAFNLTNNGNTRQTTPRGLCNQHGLFPRGQFKLRTRAGFRRDIRTGPGTGAADQVRDLGLKPCSM